VFASLASPVNKWGNQAKLHMSLTVLYKKHAKIKYVVHSSHRMCGTLKTKKCKKQAWTCDIKRFENFKLVCVIGVLGKQVVKVNRSLINL
jgi:hypothetical protein